MAHPSLLLGLPYLCIIHNCIIINIVTSSKLYPKPEDLTLVTEPELARVSRRRITKIWRWLKKKKKLALSNHPFKASTS
ncbi:hypothetical protein EV1_040030 [Malus domestica]